MTGYEAPGLLRLEVSYGDAPDLRSVSYILDRLANAFTQQLGREYQLQVTHIEIASLKAWLDLITKAHDLYEQRELLGQFVREVAAAIESVLAGGINIPPALRSLLRSVCRPIVTGRADSAKLQVNGDNNTIVYIERAEATEILRLLAPRINPYHAETTVPEQPAIDPVVIRGITDLESAELATPPIKQSPRYNNLPLARIPGTNESEVMEVKIEQLGAWYANPGALNGTMIPAVLPRDLELDPDFTYIARGRILYAGEHMMTFRVSEIITQAHPSRNAGINRARSGRA